MSLSNVTLPEINVNANALASTRLYAVSAGNTTLKFSLSSLLFGILTTLSGVTVYFLVSGKLHLGESNWADVLKDSRQGALARTSVKVLLLGTVLLYASSSTYMAALIWVWSSGNRYVDNVTNGLFSPSYDVSEDMAAFGRVQLISSWMMTITLVINFIIGDAIVWWRACVIWRNKVVYCVGPILLTLTLVTSVVGAYMSRNGPTNRLQLLIAGNPYADVSPVLSFASNAVATSLIAYKAWEHRLLLKTHFGANGTKSGVLKALALLIESGSLYCALLVFIVAYQMNPEPRSDTGMMLRQVGSYFIYGCLVHLVAIYPSIIIVIVALQRSPIDHGGLSGVQGQALNSGQVEEGTANTVSFHLSTFISE